MKVRALKKFETIRDLERNIIPKEGEVWETSEERAKFLLGHGVIEIVEEIKEEKKNNFKLDNNGNVTVEINTILDGKKIAEGIRLTAKPLEEAKEEDTLTKKQSKEYKTTKKKTSKKEVK